MQTSFSKYYPQILWFLLIMKNIPTKPARIITSLGSALGRVGLSAVYEAGVKGQWDKGAATLK